MSGLDFDAIRMRQMRQRREFCGETERHLTPDDHTAYHAAPFPRQCPYDGCTVTVASAHDLNEHARAEH